MSSLNKHIELRRSFYLSLMRQFSHENIVITWTVGNHISLFGYRLFSINLTLFENKTFKTVYTISKRFWKEVFIWDCSCNIFHLVKVISLKIKAFLPVRYDFELFQNSLVTIIWYFESCRHIFICIHSEISMHFYNIHLSQKNKLILIEG